MQTEAQLVSDARADLAALGYAADWIVASVDGAGRWRVTLGANGREFVFGNLGNGEFRFCERRGGRDEEWVAATLSLASDRWEVRWAYAFTLLGWALRDPRFRGFRGPVL